MMTRLLTWLINYKLNLKPFIHYGWETLDFIPFFLDEFIHTHLYLVIFFFFVKWFNIRSKCIWNSIGNSRLRKVKFVIIWRRGSENDRVTLKDGDFNASRRRFHAKNRRTLSFELDKTTMNRRAARIGGFSLKGTVARCSAALWGL